MRFRIHRAADEIGGNCIELEAQGKSILLDLGLPLVAGEPTPAFLPAVEGLSEGGNPNLLGILISHPHQDHYGLLSCAHSSVPVHIGEFAKRMLAEAAFFTGIARIPQPVSGYKSGQRFNLGPFTITPLSVDHSAYDAHALLIEADGKRLLYSGDFRSHGRKADVMKALLSNPPKDIDVLLMEGTTIGRADEASAKTEDEVELEIANSIQATAGFVLAYFSPQNVDRLLSFANAAAQVDRTFVVDVYTARLLDALAEAGVPTPHKNAMRVFLPKRQKLQIVRAKRFDLVKPYGGLRIFPEELAAHPKRWVVMFRSSMRGDFEGMGSLPGSSLIYSLWPGYLDRDRDDLRAWAAQRAVDFKVIHSSGHAYRQDLVRFAQAMAPKKLVPIHTVHPDRYAALFPNVQVVGNLAWQDV